MLNIDDLYRGPSEPIDTSIGKLVIYDPTADDIKFIRNRMAKTEGPEASIKFVDLVLQKLCFFHSQILPDKKVRPSTHLTQDQIDNLVIDDYEKIARICIDRNVFHVSERLNNSISMQSDSYVESLWDSVSKHFKFEDESRNALLAKLKPLTPSLVGEVMKTQQLASKLAAMSFVNRTIPQLDERPFEPLPKLPNYGQQQLDAFQTLTEQVKNLSEVSETQKKFIVQSSETQQGILTELTGLNSATSNTSKSNFLYTKIVIVLSVLATLPAWISLFDDSSERQEILLNQLIQSQSQTRQSINDLAEMIAKERLDATQVNALQTEIKQLKAEVDSLKEAVKKEMSTSHGKS